MDAKQAMRCFWATVGAWLVACAVVGSLAADGAPSLPPALNLVLIDGLSLAVVITFIMWRAKVVESRIECSDTGRDELQAQVTGVRSDLKHIGDRVDHRDAVIYRDFIRRLDRMREWMMRPAIPKSAPKVVRAKVAVLEPSSQEPTQELSTLMGDMGPSFDAELRGFLAREESEPEGFE